MNFAALWATSAGWCTAAASTPSIALRELASDVDVFESALHRARRSLGADALVHLQEAIAAYGGPFLPEFGDAQWAVDRGAQLHREFAGALAAAGRILVEGRRPGEAAEVYRRAIEHDPLDETAHRRLMRCLAGIRRARARGDGLPRAVRAVARRSRRRACG